MPSARMDEAPRRFREVPFHSLAIDYPFRNRTETREMRMRRGQCRPKIGGHSWRLGGFSEMMEKKNNRELLIRRAVNVEAVGKRPSAVRQAVRQTHGPEQRRRTALLSSLVTDDIVASIFSQSKSRDL